MAHDPVSALLSSPLLSTPPLSTPDTNDSSPSPKTRRHRSWEGSPASTLSRAESIPIFFDGARSSPERGLGLSRDVSMPDDVSMYSRGSPKETPKATSRSRFQRLSVDLMASAFAQGGRLSTSTQMSASDSNASSASTAATSVFSASECAAIVEASAYGLLPPVDVTPSRRSDSLAYIEQGTREPLTKLDVQTERNSSRPPSRQRTPVRSRPSTAPSPARNRSEEDERAVGNAQRQLFGDYKLPPAASREVKRGLRHAKSLVGRSSMSKDLPPLPPMPRLHTSPPRSSSLAAVSPARTSSLAAGRPSLAVRRSQPDLLGDNTSVSALPSPNPSSATTRKISLIIDQEGFREIEATFTFACADPELGMLAFTPVERLACPFHQAALQTPPVLRHLLVEDSGDRSFITRQATLPLKRNEVYAVEGVEEKDTRWRFVYEVEERTSLMGKILPGEKCLIPLAFSCTPELLDPARSRKNKLMRVVRNTVASRLVASPVKSPSRAALLLDGASRLSIDSFDSPSTGRSRITSSSASSRPRSASSSAGFISSRQSSAQYAFGDELAQQQRMAMSQLGNSLPPPTKTSRSRTTTESSGSRRATILDPPILVLPTPLTPLNRPPSRHKLRSTSVTTPTGGGRKRGMSEVSRFSVTKGV